MIFDICEFGAVGDGKKPNTGAIQRAIDTAFDAGGGTVLVENGVYKTGTIILKSNITLHIEANATLIGSEKCEDYPERADVRHVVTENLPRHKNACLIYAEECENIAITGSGKIDCNGENFVVTIENDDPKWTYKRIDAPTPPRVVFFVGCSNIKVEDVTMVNQPAGWSYWIHDCDYVMFDKCKILADVNYPNNDGIHINSSRNVTISNCFISCGDDCIVVRANNLSLKENKICEKVTVTNCNLTSHANAIRIAWLNDGVIKNCTFSNIVITDSVAGIAILLPSYQEDMADKGREATLVENILFDNIVMDNIWIRPVKILVSSNEKTMCEAIRNIHFSRLYSKSSRSPYIIGKEDCEIKNITFSDCKFERIPKPEHVIEWPDVSDREMIEYAENVVFNNTSIIW